MLVAADAAALGEAVKWEHSPSRGEEFPHLFSALPLSAVRWTAPITRDASGTFVLPAPPR